MKAQPSLALGTAEVNLLELVSAYAPFANGGTAVWPHGIIEIRDGRNYSGKQIGKNPGNLQRTEPFRF